MAHDCQECGRPNRRGGPTCSRCYQAEYRQRPGRGEAHRRAVIAYQRRNPEKRIRWVRAYRQRVGWYNPDLTALRAALKRLESAVATTARRQGVRSTGE